jgi:hypothetical protein
LVRNQFGAETDLRERHAEARLLAGHHQIAAQSSSVPPAIASPGTTATTGTGQSSMARGMSSMPLGSTFSPTPPASLSSAVDLADRSGASCDADRISLDGRRTTRRDPLGFECLNIDREESGGAA